MGVRLTYTYGTSHILPFGASRIYVMQGSLLFTFLHVLDELIYAYMLFPDSDSEERLQRGK